MKTIILVTCSATKKKGKYSAKNLYCSKRFILAKKLAHEHSDKWFIISAKYGLIEPDKVISFYDKQLEELNDEELKLWNNSIFNKLRAYFTEKTRVICLGEEKYFSNLEACLSLSSYKVTIHIPFRHIEKSKIISWLEKVQSTRSCFQDVKKFYNMLSSTQIYNNQLRLFSECNGSMNWPKRGLYIFFRQDENRSLSGNSLKAVRVGTHAVSFSSTSSLWQRIKSHKGNSKGLGNHRSSVFRLHIGSSIINKEKILLPSWGRKVEISEQVKKLEMEVERQVTLYMDSMLVLYLEIGDKPSKNSDRAYLEQNIIALLSGIKGPVDFADESWLGYYCENNTVRESSLWNVNHTRMGYDPDFFQVLQHYIDITSGKVKDELKSIAPDCWLEDSKTGYQQKSFKLF